MLNKLHPLFLRCCYYFTKSANIFLAKKTKKRFTRLPKVLKLCNYHDIAVPLIDDYNDARKQIKPRASNCNAGTYTKRLRPGCSCSVRAAVVLLTMRCCTVAPDVALLAQTSRFLEPGAFAVFKGLVALYFLGWCLLWPVRFNGMYLFVSFWGWYFGAIYFTLSCITACMYLRRCRAELARSLGGGGGDGEGQVAGRRAPSWSTLVSEAPTALATPRTCVPGLEQAILIVQLATWNISCISSLVFCTLYWTSVYDGAQVTTVDINAHAFFAFIMVVDQLLVASRFRIRHVWKTEVFATVYLVFNISYYYLASTGDKLIYIILDWGRDPWGAVGYSALTLFVLIPVFAILHYCLFRLRESMYATCREKVESAPGVLDDRLLGAATGGDSTLPESSTSHAALTGTTPGTGANI